MAADAVGVDGRGATAAGPKCGVPGIPQYGGRLETEINEIMEAICKNKFQVCLKVKAYFEFT